MKATLFAAVLSFSVVSLSTYASTQAIAQDVKITAPPVMSQVIKKINLNTASVQELTGSFKGVGKKRAEAIVSYREAHGGFKSIEDLAQVRGLGKTFVESHLAQLQDVFSVE